MIWVDIINIHAVEYLKAAKKHYNENEIRLYCICQKPAQGTHCSFYTDVKLTLYVLRQYFGPCQCCDMYYHAECLGRNEEQLLKDKQEGKAFFFVIGLNHTIYLQRNGLI